MRIIQIASILFFIFLSFGFYIAALDLTAHNLNESDSRQNLAYAFNLAHYKTFSIDHTEVKTPSAYREPLYPLILAGFFKFQPDLINVNEKQFLQQLTYHDIIIPQLKTVIYFNFAVFVFLAILTSHCVLLLTKNHHLADVAPYLFFLFPKVTTHFIQTISHELIASMLLLWLSLKIYQFIHREKLVDLVAASVTLGLLVLTKAHFLYLLLPTVSGIIIWCYKKHKTFKRVLLYCGIHSIVVLIVLSPWLVRNYRLYQRLFISERGGVLLAYRVQYNQMNLGQYLYAMPFFFKYYFNSKSAHRQ